MIMGLVRRERIIVTQYVVHLIVHVEESRNESRGIVVVVGLIIHGIMISSLISSPV